MKNFVKFSDIFSRMVDERRARNVDTLCKYGVGLLDEALGGILENELVVIGAGSGIGKTELAVQIAINNAMNGKKVALYSLEGDICEIAYRYAQTQINIELKSRKQEYLTGPEFRMNLVDVRVHEDRVKEQLSSLLDNIFIYESGTIPNSEELILSIGDAQSEVDMFILDHLHYLDFGDKEYEGISSVVKKLKEITEKIRKPVILISHLSSAHAQQKRDPTIYDLHGSSNIQKNANTVILLARGTMEYQEKHLASTKIIIGKNRSGVRCPLALDACFNIATKQYEKGNRFNSYNHGF